MDAELRTHEQDVVVTDTDLTPRERAPKKKRSLLPLALVVVVVVAIGALMFKTLGDASLFFKNVDAAIDERDSLGDKRFRMQGTVVPGTIVNGEVAGRGAVLFTVSYNGVMADVASYDNPTELFKDGIPVVLEGSWRATTGSVISLGCDGVEAQPFASGARDGWYFASDRILVKHDASYEEANQGRIDDASTNGGYASGATGPAAAGSYPTSCRSGGTAK